jgi:hypothetical protein
VPIPLNQLAAQFPDAGTDREDFESKLVRVSCAAEVHSVDKKSTAIPSRLLRSNKELELLDEHARSADQDRTCPHCRLTHGALYDPAPPIAVLNHQARIQAEFDPDTNVSAAEIKHFQVLLPREVAIAFIELGHPLNWPKAAPELFAACTPAFYHRGDDWRFDMSAADWRSALKYDGRAFIREVVTLPWTPDIATVVDNIIRIDPRDQRHFDSIPPDLAEAEGRALAFDYSVEACRASRVGTLVDAPGVDIDGGHFDAIAVPVDTAVQMHLLDGLTPRDLRHLELDFGARDSSGPNSVKNLILQGSIDLTIPSSDAQKARQAASNADAVRRLAVSLREKWGVEFWVVDVSARKEIHYTDPPGSTTPLWAVITWMAPAALFVLLNRGICQTPHFLISEFLREHKPMSSREEAP